MIIHIPADLDGRVLRSYLKLTLGISTAALSQLKNNERGILINGRRVTVRYVLRAGDVLELADRDTPEGATERVIPTELPLSVLYEDEYVIALDKPADMPTHPSHGHLTDTLANALAYRYERADEPFVFRPLGRLDRNTSGVVLVGKTRAASGALSKSLKNGDVRKRYIAILTGVMPVDGEAHTLIAPISREPLYGIRRKVCDPDAEGAVYAETRYLVLDAHDGHSLVLCEPVTGRTHQLRVHFSHLGHPILGDEIYGEPSALIDRHALHAISISAPLPFYDLYADKTVSASSVNAPDEGGILHTWAALPEDMAGLVERFFPTSPVRFASRAKELLELLTPQADERTHT